MKSTKKWGKMLLAGMFSIMLAFSFSSCATNSSIGGTSDVHGLISQAKVAADGTTEIASYSVILGLLDSGYSEYAEKVKAAETSGKQITTVTTWFVFLTKVTAYSR
ncbi:hypothetical protein AGMMS50212_10520 [Spirochaetia bacterium]|nr:hypothetical protein AGMMS50212_10520 [Spirochaetia bacterium]